MGPGGVLNVHTCACSTFTVVKNVPYIHDFVLKNSAKELLRSQESQEGSVFSPS